MPRRAAIALGSAVMLLAGCGGSGGGGAGSPAICLLKTQQAIAHNLSVSSNAIRFAKSVGTNGMPQCSFSIRTAGRRVVVTANVDDGPSAYFRLLRTVDEATQLFGPPPPGFHAPETVAGLGPFASWFPNTHQLMATNNADLDTVTVTWPGGKRGPEVSLAHAAIVPYLARKHGHGSAIDYP